MGSLTREKQAGCGVCHLFPSFRGFGGVLGLILAKKGCIWVKLLRFSFGAYVCVYVCGGWVGGRWNSFTAFV